LQKNNLLFHKTSTLFSILILQKFPADTPLVDDAPQINASGEPERTIHVINDDSSDIMPPMPTTSTTVETPPTMSTTPAGVTDSGNSVKSYNVFNFPLGTQGPSIMPLSVQNPNLLNQT
jgi:hypothetical protein